MRHLAWLHAVPEGSKDSRLKAYKALDENSSFLQFPDLEEAHYLIALINELGLCESSGMSISPISWLEIDAWIRCTGTELSTWEVLILRAMSEAYVSEYSQASAKDRPAPYSKAVEDLEETRNTVANKLRNAFSSLKKQQQTPDE